MNDLILTDQVFVPTKSGLVIRGIPSFEDWETYGQKLQLVEGSIQWLIGDWLTYGEQRWGEIYAQALDETQAHTWVQYKWVASRVANSTRVELSWSHHREVADLTPNEQAFWLQLAEQHGWSVRQLHQEIKHLGLPPPAWQGMWEKVGDLARELSNDDDAPDNVRKTAELISELVAGDITYE